MNLTEVAELQVRAASLNRLTKLGTPTMVLVGSIRLGLGETRFQADLYEKALKSEFREFH